jgi:hypothetical protein
MCCDVPISIVDAMQSSTHDTYISTVLEPTSSKEDGKEEMIREEEVVTTTLRDMCFWLVMIGLLFVTFISALDLTDKSICLFNHDYEFLNGNLRLFLLTRGFKQLSLT